MHINFLLSHKRRGAGFLLFMWRRVSSVFLRLKRGQKRPQMVCGRYTGKNIVFTFLLFQAFDPPVIQLDTTRHYKKSPLCRNHPRYTYPKPRYCEIMVKGRFK